MVNLFGEAFDFNSDDEMDVLELEAELAFLEEMLRMENDETDEYYDEDDQFFSDF